VLDRQAGARVGGQSGIGHDRLERTPDDEHHRRVDDVLLVAPRWT
jgi:hypothetical protein